MNDNKIFTAADMTNFVVNFAISNNENEILNVWKKVVSKIGKKKEDDDEALTLGEKLAANSHVVDLKNGVLLVEVNHSGWIQYFKFNQKFILQGLKWALPDLKINSLAFRVTGSNANLSDSYENQVKKYKSEMNKKIDEQEKILSKYQKQDLSQNEEKKSSLPPELEKRFENIKKMILTNSKK